MNRHRVSYQAYLAGLTDPELGAIVGGDVAAMSDSTSSAWRSIGIGVATGALTFLVTKLLESFFESPRSSR